MNIEEIKASLLIEITLLNQAYQSTNYKLVSECGEKIAKLSYLLQWLETNIK